MCVWNEEIPFHWVARSDSFFLHLEGAPVVHCYWGPCTHLGKSSRPFSGTFLSPWGALNNSVCQPFNFHFAHARRQMYVNTGVVLEKLSSAWRRTTDCLRRQCTERLWHTFTDSNSSAFHRKEALRRSS